MTQNATMTHRAVEVSVSKAVASAGRDTLVIPESMVDIRVPMAMTESATHLLATIAATRPIVAECVDIT